MRACKLMRATKRICRSVRQPVSPRCVIVIRSFLLAIDRAQQDEETATIAGDGYSWC